jgi:alpha-1,3-glucosyltransferase
MVEQLAPQVHLRAFLSHPEKFLPPLLIIYTCLKILLMPTYRSTDFDVHRNWLAITHKLPLSEWYFDNVNGTTMHTLDYPPAFAFFEWMLSNNPITHKVLPPGDRCLDLLPDSDNAPSDACVVFQRSTVILSDVCLWIGAYVACRAMYHERPVHYSTLSFLLIVLNPGLLWLDHIHFQYNGMLLGILLASLGLLMHGNNVKPDTWVYDLYHLGGAALFALLLNLKHLYLPLAPLYFCYLLGKYCMAGKRFLFVRFFMLAEVTVVSLLLPWIPFLLQESPKDQLIQIAARLFPFGRGLVHDYWAANIWAVYTLADKVVQFVASRVPGFPLTSLPEPSPLVCAILLLGSLTPALWVASTRQTNVKLIQAVVYISFCSFMLAYHVHEKAILTTLLPLSLLVGQRHYGSTHNVLFWHVSLWGLLGLFPLLFTPVELAFKLVSYVTYLAICSFLLSTPSIWTRGQQTTSCVLAGGVICILEFLPIHGKWEFLPLMITSIVSAQGLIGCWALSLWLLLKHEKPQVAQNNEGGIS